MLLSVISGTYNRIDYLKAMVESARASMPRTIEYEFVITDGASTDGSLEWMREQKDIRVIEHGALKGAIAAFNDAGAAARGEYLVVANDDIEFVGLSIAKGLSFIMDNADVGAVAFYQDRGGKDWHVESMPVYENGEQKWLPYLQVGIIPRWLWDKCEGWGNWGGRTYGGDNYLSGRIYESGYKLTPMEACRITDKTPLDELRRINNDNRKPDANLWAAFPDGFRISDTPIWPNPLPERKRVLYAPIIEAGHDVQKEQKKGLREALRALGEVWEVDYVYGKENIGDAAEAWQPHYIVTQFHAAEATSMEEIKKLKASCQGYMANFAGDVWADQASPELLEMLRYYDLQLTVNAALIPRYTDAGVKAVYWQNSAEPDVYENPTAMEAKYDVVFLGNNYSEYRTRLARSLKALPYRVGVYGRGYPEGVSDGESLYNFRMTGGLYRSSRIAIADNQFPEAIGFASDRMFMVLASGGACLFHQRVEKIEQLTGLIPGVHFVEWATEAGLKAKIAYYMEHEYERLAIAKAGTAAFFQSQTFDARVSQIKTMLAAIPKKKPKISAMMIVKNEELNIWANLKALKWADEIVVVDTGSEDNTLGALLGGTYEPAIRIHQDGAAVVDESLLFRRGNLSVYQYAWNDDFAAARNFAKGKCTGDWIFWMDADDRLPDDTIKRLSNFSEWTFRSLGVTNPGAFRFLVTDVRDGGMGQHGFQTRLFKNLPLIEWRTPIHETVDDSIKDIGITCIAMSAVKVSHCGPTDKHVIERKQRRNLAILEKMPACAWRSYQKGASYAHMERWGDAVVWFEIAEGEATDAEFKSFLAFCAGNAFLQMGLEQFAKRKLVTSDYLDAIYLRAELEKKTFPADLYRRFLKSPLPTLFPTFAQAWKPLAKGKLLDWHQKELEALVT